MPTLLNPDPEVSCSSHRAADEASHLHDVCPRTGAMRLSAGYWFAGSIPVPASTENLRDRLAPAGVSDVGARERGSAESGPLSDHRGARLPVASLGLIRTA
jgi:hypothetical protein